MKQKIKTSISIVTLSCTTLFLNVQRISAQSPDKVALEMVKALKNNPCGLGGLQALAISLEGEEKASFDGTESRALDILLATTKEYLTGQQKAQLLMDTRGWFMARRPLTKTVIEMYLARYAKVDLSTVNKWRIEEGKSGFVGNSTSLTLQAIVFKDFLWDNTNWQNGNPGTVLVRLGSLSTDAVSRWEILAKANGHSAYGSWILLAVDALFVNDIFQQSVFDGAFPLAEKLLSSGASKSNANSKSIVPTVLGGDMRTKTVEYLDENTYLLVEISNDKTYGFDESNPIKVGGKKEGSGLQNQKEFLNALMGPNGEEIKYFSTGSCCQFRTLIGNRIENTGMLEKYRVYWNGIKDTLSIYINPYHQGDLKIPFGLTAKKKSSDSAGKLQGDKGNINRKSVTSPITQSIIVNPVTDAPEYVSNLLDSSSLTTNIILTETDTFMIMTTKKLFTANCEQSIKKSNSNRDKELLKLFTEDTSRNIYAKKLIKTYPLEHRLNFRIADLLQSGQCIVYNKIKKRLEKQVKFQTYNTQYRSGKRFKTVDNYLLLETIEKIY